MSSSSSSSSSGGYGPAPTNLNATATTSSTVSLSWNDNSSGEDGFHIQRSTDSNDGFTTIANASIGTQSHADSGLAPETTYYYRVRAHLDGATSSWSNTASATTLAGTTNTTITLQENQTGFCGVDGTVDSNHGGFTGDGFANTHNVYGNGIDWAFDGDDGSYTLIWRFANGSSTNRTAVVNINGQPVSTGGFSGTGSWSSWTTVSTTLDLAAGFKALRLESNQSSALANIDYLEITGPNVSAADCGSADSQPR